MRRSAEDTAIHENPLHGADNRVYVRVRNRGCDEAASTTVHLYWAKASTSLAWPDPWTGNVSLDEAGEIKMGGQIGEGQITPSIAPGESEVVGFTWDTVPNPLDYAEYGADKTHFCLLAYIDDEPPAAVDLPELVRWRNDIAWRNVSVVGEEDELDSHVFIGGTADAETHRLVFEVPEDVGTVTSIFEWGTVFVDLGPELYQRWLDAGALGEGIEDQGDGRVRLTHSGAVLRGVRLDQAEFLSIRLAFQPNPYGESGERERLDVYLFDVTQYAELNGPDSDPDELRLVGSLRTQLKVQTPIFFAYPPT